MIAITGAIDQIIAALDFQTDVRERRDKASSRDVVADQRTASEGYAFATDGCLDCHASMTVCGPSTPATPAHVCISEPLVPIGQHPVFMQQRATREASRIRQPADFIAIAGATNRCHGFFENPFRLDARG